MGEQEEIRALFLSEFTKMLIFSSMPSLFETFEKTIAQGEVRQELQIEEKKQEEIELAEPSIHIMQESSKQAVVQPQQIQQISQRVQPKFQAVPVQRVQPVGVQKTMPVQQLVRADGMGMSILLPLINDPSITAIECIEAGKPLMIARRGLRQPTNIVLTNDEIKSIMDEVSAKTKIPLLPGIFKVAYLNLIVTAIISEYIGTRFIIQKKVPVAPAPHRQFYRL